MRGGVCKALLVASLAGACVPDEHVLPVDVGSSGGADAVAGGDGGGGAGGPSAGGAGCEDQDEDGFSSITCGGSDCDDEDPAIHPAQTEVFCNDIDDDCFVDTGDRPDVDEDGYSVCDGDCNDLSPSLNPGTDEIACNGVDDDCDASTPDVPQVDADGDGALLCDDCDDQNPARFPGNPEICGDQADQDCNGNVGCPVCGDGVLEVGEPCDDGGTIGGDGCRADCLGLEICGDGLADLHAGEDCDPPQDGACLGACSGCACPSPGAWAFVDVTAAAGLAGAAHEFDESWGGIVEFTVSMMSAGVAVGDYDGDGWIDLYTIGGDLGANHLWRNQGDGTFLDVAVMAGVELPQSHGIGPTFADFTGDGAIDLFVGSIDFAPHLFENQLDGTFAEIPAPPQFLTPKTAIGASFGDIDGDGDLDMFVSRYFSDAPAEFLFENLGGGSFSGITIPSGLGDLGTPSGTFAFTPNFADLDFDGDLDLLVTQDYGFSKVFHGVGDGTFFDATTNAITDENGMGATVTDIDHDGDLDWIVTSIFSPGGASGNRVYLNMGNGAFEEASLQAGVRQGSWGWGVCAADFNLDGYVDLFHTNGWRFVVSDTSSSFFDDPSRLFLSNGDGTFTERSLELGIDDTGQGRGVVCFDYDRDGDVDLFVVNNGGPARLVQNNGVRVGNYLHVALAAPAPNLMGVGSTVVMTAGSHTHAQVIRAGSNYVSQDPAVAHYGLGDATSADLTVHWAHGGVSTFVGVAANQEITLSAP